MSEFFDVLETRAPEQRERELMAACPAPSPTRWRARRPAEQLRGVDPATIDSRAALARLPVLRSTSCWNASTQPRRRRRAAGPVKAFGGFSAIGWASARVRLARPDL